MVEKSDNTPSSTQGKGSKTVTVACKLPHGLQLRLFKMVDFDEAVFGGGVRVSKRAEPCSDIVVLKGYSAPHGMQPNARLIGGPLGFALTPGVDKEFFEQWLEQNKGSDVVKGKFVFCHASTEAVADQANEHKKLKNGLEPLDPKNLPRVSKTMKVEKYNKESEAA